MVTRDDSLPRIAAPHRRRPAARLRATVAQLASFGAVGGLAFIVDTGVYNALRLTVLTDKPIGAKIASVAVATVVAWLGNRYLTFRAHRHVDRRAVVREALLFGGINVAGLGIATACLYVSHYVLGFTSTLADNLAGNVVGLVLGMIFRFAAYRLLVFRHRDAADPERAADVVGIDPMVEPDEPSDEDARVLVAAAASSSDPEGPAR